MRQYLDDLEHENPLEPELPRQDKVSATDPDAAYFSKGDRASKLGYFDNYLMDNASCVIVGVEATVASSSQEVISARTMIADCADKFGLAPKTLAADTGYGNADFLIFSRGLRAGESLPIPRCDCTNQLYGLDHFTYQPETNSFECPEGKQLKYRGIKPAANRSHIYRSTEAQCRECLRKAECTSGRYKQLVIHVNEEVRQRARELNSRS